MKILFLFPYPLEQAPSQRFRFEQYFAALLKQGYSIDRQSFWGEYYWKVLYKKGNTLQKAWGLLNGFARRFKVLGGVSSADFVFIHRELTPLGPPIFEWLITKVFSKKVIFDFDDAIWLPNTSESNKIAGWLKWHSKTESICRWSWKVSAGNSYLAHYAKQFNDYVVISPTTIDTEHHHRINKKPKPTNDPILIGWTGSHSTLPYLDMLWPALEQLAKDEKFSFRVISNQPPPVNYPWLEFIAWNKETEIDDLAAIDIGVMPLTDDKWSKGKCGFKALQYMALEISTVASPVGVNTDIIKDGINGLMATNTEEWVFALKKLIKSTALRTQLSEEGRRTVENTYSVKANIKNFLELFGK
ncbi:glycosyltransferase family 4 protein [uncultured Imperialibacter sp.]|uniref:glycosyltransferase family 4 protein n=1 Tax=uncultured Imperialibacter sp. TaxID=1672639 RepID=UPI0030DA4BD5